MVARTTRLAGRAVDVLTVEQLRALWNRPDPKWHAVASYNARCALFVDILTTGTPDENERRKCALGYAVVSRGRNGEVFGDPSRHLELPVDTLLCSW